MLLTIDNIIPDFNLTVVSQTLEQSQTAVIPEIGLTQTTPRILIDVGSSTVKVYQKDAQNLRLLFTRSISFKQGFYAGSSISDKSKQALFELVTEVQDQYPRQIIKIYATALFRALSGKARQRFVDEFFRRTDLYFNIISHDLESFYLRTALAGRYHPDGSVLLVNVGGGSTELVVMHKNEVIEAHNINLGVGTLLEKFPEINSRVSEVDLGYVVALVDDKLPPLESQPEIAFYNGGELNYMRLAGYALQPNRLFSDPDHPSIIDVADYKARNAEVFSRVTLQELESLMPEDPRWMHGARGCSAIAQAVFEKYSIGQIVPSDSNLIDGVARQEFRSVVISGSFRKHLDYILQVREVLIRQGVEVLSPRFTEPNNRGEPFVVFEGEEGLSPLELERSHLDAILQADVLVICSPEGYVGASAMIEIGHAVSLGKRIIFTENPEEFMLNALPAEVGL